MTAAQGDRLQIVGDDIFATDPAFIRRGIREKAANAVLIKLNQIGTVIETIQTIDLCRQAGWRFVISHRSGETGHLHGRFRGRHERRSDQDRVRLPRRADCQVQ
jgi:enolase